MTSARKRSTSAESSDVPSNNLAELLEQLGTLNNRHEQLRALVEALEVKSNLKIRQQSVPMLLIIF